eukprot:tig00000093_g3527.t1
MRAIAADLAARAPQHADEVAADGVAAASGADARDLVRMFNRLLRDTARAVPRGGLLVLVLDAVDELRGPPAGAGAGAGAAACDLRLLELRWLPAALPRGLLLVVSLGASPASHRLARALVRTRGLRALAVPALLRPDQQLDLVERRLALAAKRLAPETAASVLARLKELPRPPLFLRLFADELALHGRHETVRAAAERLLEARSVPELYGAVLGRWAAEYGPELADAVRAVRVTERGAPEPDLLRVLQPAAARPRLGVGARPGASGAAVAGARWCRLRAVLAGLTSVRDGVVTLIDADAVAAVDALLLDEKDRGVAPFDDPRNRLHWHRRWAGYLQSLPAPSPQQKAHLRWHEHFLESYWQEGKGLGRMTLGLF